MRRIPALMLVTCLGASLAGGAATALYPASAAAQDARSLSRAKDLNAEALERLRQAKYAEGIAKAREALAIGEQAFAPGHPVVAESLYVLAELLLAAGDHPAARPLYERALRIRQRAFGPDHGLVAGPLTGLAELLRMTGDYAAARPLYERALRIRERALGPDHSAVAITLHGLAELLRRTGDHARARALFERALRIREQALGPEHAAVAATLNSLAELVRDRGEYGAARPLFERALRIRERALGPEHPALAATLTEFAELRRMTGDYAAARPLFERALRIRERALGPDHVGLAFTLNDFADLLRFTGDYAASRPLYERALWIRERALGPDHPLVAGTLNGLAELLRQTGDHAAARPLLERALRIRERAFGPRHPAVGRTLSSLAQVLIQTGDHAAGRPLLERALVIYEQAFGPGHRGVGRTLSSLAQLLIQTGDHAAALPVFERALGIARSGEMPETRWRAAFGLGRLHEREARLLDALPLYQEAVRTLEGLAGQFGEEGSRTQYLQAESRLSPYDALARVLLKLHERDASRGYDREAWAVIEARKGRVVAEALAAARPKPQDTRTRADAERVQAKQDEALALEEALRAEQSKAPQEQEPERVQHLTTLLAQTKAEYLGQVQAFLARYPQYKSQFVDQQTVDPKALAKFAGQLPPGTLAVQYFAAPEALYLFVVAPGRRFGVKRQDVAQQDLYGLIREYRQLLARAARAPLPWLDDGSEAHRRDVVPLKEVMRKLSAHLLGPIEADLGTHPNLILIPNDLLLYLPIHALVRAQPDGSVRFLAETHAVSYVTQLELMDLLSPAQPAPNAPLLAMANPDGTLPGATREIRALRRVRPAVTVLEGVEATKAKFLSLVSQFPDLHLATHGVLDPSRPERSYLLMAGEGAEHRLGIQEIAGLSLSRGLVVLSACETAVGEQVPGAALITLSAAFSQAGAQSIVASLWKVEDAATRDFMTAFHGALPAGGRAAALQKAQLSVLGNPRTAHPYYWAAFVLIGAR